MDNTLPTIKEDRRNYGIDLLRIVSMIMVLVLHILGRGGILYSDSISSINSDIAWFLEISCFCAVNCFGMVSGFVGYKSKHKYANILYLNLQVTFLLLISITIFKIRYPNAVTITDFKKASMPFCFYVLWYYRAYFCMFSFIPLMNKGMELMNRNEGRMLVASIFILLTIIPTCLNDDVYTTSSGYSCFWLMGCYMVGAYFSKYEIEKKIKWWALLIILIVSIIFAFSWFKVPYNVFFLSYLVDYTSPTIFINGAMLVLLFAKMKPHKVTKYIIKFFAPLAFSVYVIHVSPYFWQKFMYNRFTNLVNLNPFLFPLAVLGIAILLFICFALIDYIRYLLFKVCRVKEFFNYLELKIRKLLSKIFKDDDKVEKKETVLEAKEENNIEIEVEK